MNSALKILASIVAVLAVVMLTGCANLEQKSFVNNTSADGMKIETSGSMTTGTILPNLWFGGIINQLATVPVLPATDKDGKPNVSQFLYMRTIRNSFFGSLFGVQDTTESITYIGAIGESAEDTAKRVNALNGLSTSTQTDSGTAGAKRASAARSARCIAESAAITAR